MGRNVIISKTAEKKLDILFDFLISKWSIKVKNKFIEKLDRSIDLIKEYPETFPSSEKDKGLKRCVITKQTTLYYRYDTKNIYVITVFDTRQHPEKLNKETNK